jgi:L-asparaginase
MKIIIHGGLLESPTKEEMEHKRSALTKIVTASYEVLLKTSATQAAVFAVTQLEDDPLFNAGTGSKLQSDGEIRMSASLMDGAREAFSGVINIEQVRNPIQIASLLQCEEDKVLSGPGAVAYARSQGVLPYSTETPQRRAEFNRKKDATRRGTVGCVAIDAKGCIAAATSTGGKGLELICRVSDSATVAGNYANRYCGVSCTGIGEDIVNNATAARIVTRVSDGLPLHSAVTITIEELCRNNGEAGIIAIDYKGAICHAFSKAEVPVAYACFDGLDLNTF